LRFVVLALLRFELQYAPVVSSSIYAAQYDWPRQSKQ